MAKRTPPKPDYFDVALAYAREADADKKNHKYCRWVRLAARRFIVDLDRATKKDCPFVFSRHHANDVCSFIEKLPHVEGKWETATITLHASQIFALANVFGFRRRSDGLRRFTTSYFEVARKNAKSTLTAGVALYCLCCENEPGPQVIIGATTGEQAQKVFRPARLMVQRTIDLQTAFDLAPLSKSIPCYQNGGFIQTINAKSDTQDGWNPHAGILDELHAHKDRGLYDVIRSAFGARRNPLMWIITTAGYSVTGVCYEQRTLLTKILQGIVQADHYWGIIYTLDGKESGKDSKGDSEYDETKWIKANPLLGVSVQLEELRGYAIEAQASPETHTEFLTKRLNVWTTAKKAHINMHRWLKNNGLCTYDDLKGLDVYGGLDLASVNDMCAFRLVARSGDRLKTWGKYYLPQGAVEPRTTKGNVPYKTWVDQGWLTVTDGDVVDYDFIEADIRKALKDLNIKGIAYDSWGAQQLINNLTSDGAPMIEFRQGIPSFNGPMKAIDGIYPKGLIDHGNNPILNWNASNVVARKDVNENIAPDKSKSHEKIDGYVALLMAYGLLTAQPDDEGQGFTATHGIVTL